jgi:branched-chain amino acid transport system ATP-binding protein
MELLEFIGLAHKADHLSRNLPYGEQRKLEIARAMASEPGLLLLDEPTAGMNPQETRATEELVFAIRDRGIAVLVIEHDMRFIFNLSDRVACLVQGEKLVEGTSEVVQGDERVVAAYLGTPFEGAPGAEELAEVEAAEAAGTAEAVTATDTAPKTEEAAPADAAPEAEEAEATPAAEDSTDTDEAPEAEETSDAPEATEEPEDATPADDSDAPTASDDSDAQGSSTSKEGTAQ